MLKKYLHFIIPIVVSAICSLFIFSSMDNKVADWFQRPLKTTVENPDVLMINVDDGSVDQIGTWPFSREVYADSIINLKELGAESVVFDLSFVDKSKSQVDEEYVTETLPEYVEQHFESINDSINYVMGSFLDGSLKPKDAVAAAEELLSATELSKNSLETNISYVMRSQDDALATALNYFDNAFLTLTFDESTEIDEDEKNYLENFIALDNIEVINDTKTPEYTNVLPAIPEFMSNAKRAGFVNADPDKDGYLRRVNMLVKYNGKYYGQLVFVPILEHFGNPKVIVSNKEIILKNCRYPDMSIRDITIPRAEDGSVIVKYPKNVDYVDYNGISLWALYRLTEIENVIWDDLSVLLDNGYFDYCEEDENPYTCYTDAAYNKDLIMNEDEDGNFDSYMNYRTKFLTVYEDFLNGSTEEIMIEDYPDDEEYIRETFEIVRDNFNTFMQWRNEVAEKVKYSMCIVGTNATSTTDYGLTQYEEHFPNPGVHYTLANQLLNADFVDDSPAWLSIIIAFILCIIYSFASNKIKSTGKQIITGLLFLVISTLALLIVFMITKTYVGVVVPFMSLLITFIVTTVIGFLTASQDKKFITNAFSQCLSKEVVADIVANPSSFKLGGQRLEMTAMFTDIQKFSGFSELLTAAQLVALLNYYLTKMSDIIMDERGTVDKYEGDAIIALVGAPVKMDDHAQRACAAAIKMKAAEVEMNKMIREIAAGEKPESMEQDLYDAFKIMVENQKTLFTRIGLNSGEMIAGYMGSENKKNYTMMGNNVNLASRLEGVNKQYHTGGIMISEATRNLLGDRFVVRSLDRVRVVNVNTPIRLYELICEKEGASEETVKYMADWESALKVFENREYAKAGEMINALIAKNPKDGVARYYLSLINNFFVKGTYPTEKDDVGVAFNDEEFVFKLLQK